jgi:hypothetical protein
MGDCYATATDDPSTNQRVRDRDGRPVRHATAMGDCHTTATNDPSTNQRVRDQTHD